MNSGSGVQATFPEQATFFEYFDASRPQTILDAVKQVHELLAAEDPLFDGVIGFSQGAMLAATILIDQSRDPSASLSPPLKCAMLACAPLPFDIKRECRFEPGDENPKIIRIPTFHVVGRQDEYYQESIGLSRLCDVTLRQIYDHGGGHEIPKKTTVTDALADGLRKCVVVADMRQ